MRKILLATTALIAFAGAAQAAESPIQVTLGGSVDFRAALFHESNKVTDAFATTNRRSSDFETNYELTVAAEGKAANGIEYGALVNLDNDPTRSSQAAVMDYAYVWMSGKFGKVLMGDEHGASSLFVYAPTVGTDQIDGSYSDFVDINTLAVDPSYGGIGPAYFNTGEDTTKVTYFTPKVGNANHKVQLGVSYAPNTEQGTTVALYDSANGDYKNTIEATAQYTGTFDPVSVVVSPMLITSEAEGNKFAADGLRDYTAWGIGAQAEYAGFTLGSSYVDAGKKSTATGQDKDQDVWSLGLAYEFDKIEVAGSFMNGEGYYNLATTDLDTTARTYVDDLTVYGIGATYTWFPGMRTAADAVFFDQNREDTGRNNKGHVLMLSQKMTF